MTSTPQHSPHIPRAQLVGRVFDVEEEIEKETIVTRFYQFQDLWDRRQAMYNRCLQQEGSTPELCDQDAKKNLPKLQMKKAREWLSVCVEGAQSKSSKEETLKELGVCLNTFKKMGLKEVNSEMDKVYQRMREEHKY